MNELEIHKYKVVGKKFEHHIPKSLVQDFKAEVKKAGKRWQFVDEDYKIASDRHQEACDEPIVEDKIFHPIDGVLIETIQEINVQIYKVPQPEGDYFIVHCPLGQTEALANQIEFQKQQSKEGEEYSITIREYREKVKNPPNNECFIPLVPKDISSKELDYQVASWFSQELNKRNIKTIEDITMTNATSEKQAVNLEFSLEQQLKALNDEQYLTLFSLYGQEGINEYNELIRDCKNLDEAKLDVVKALAERINNDNSEDKQELLGLLEQYHLNYYGKDASLDSLKTQIKDARKDLKDIVNGFNNKLSKLVPEDKLLLLKQEKEERKLNKAKLRRQKRIERGLDAHLMAVACAVIEDGRDGGDKYIEKANKQANEVLNKAVAVVNEMNNDDRQPDPKSKKGMKKVFKASLPKKAKSKGFATSDK